MSIESSQSSVTYVGTGTGTVFPIPMRVDAKSDLVVTRQDAAGEISRLEEGRDYRVETVATDYNEPEPREVVLHSPLAQDWHLTIRRVVPLTQEHTLGNQGAIFPKTMERSLDKLTMIAQQLDRDNQETRQRVTLTEEDLDSLLDRATSQDTRLANSERDIAGIKGDAVVLKSRVDNLSGTVGTVENGISVLDGSLSGVVTRVDGLAGTVGTIDRTVSELSGTVHDVAGRADSLDTFVGSLTTLVDGLDERVQELEGREWGGGGAGEEMSTRLGTVETRVEDIDTRVGSLATASESILVRTGDLENKTSALEGLAGTLKTTADDLETRTTGLRTATDELVTLTGTLTGDGEALKTASDSHERKILRLEERTQEVETKTSTLTLKVLELESGNGGGSGDPEDPGIGSGVIQEIDTRFGVVEGNVTRLRTDLDDLDGRLQASVTALTNGKANAATVSDLTNRVVTLETSENTLADRFAAKAEASAVTALATRVGEMADDVATLGSRADTAASDVADIETRVGTVETDTAALAGRVGQVETAAGANASEMESLKTTTGNVTTRIENMEGAVSGLSGRVDGKADATVVTGLDGRVGNVEILSGSLDTRTQSMNGKIESLESRADSLTTGLSAKAAASDLTALTGRVGTLEITTGGLSTSLQSKADSATVADIEGRVSDLEAGGGGGGSSGGGDGGSGRQLATKDLKFYLHPNGNDANTGLSGTRTLKTIARLQEILRGYDFNGYALTVSFAAGVFGETLVLDPENTLGARLVTIMNSSTSLPTLGGGMEKGIVINNVIAPGGVVLTSMVFDGNTIGLHVINSRVTATGTLEFRAVSGQCILAERSDVTLSGTPTLSDSSQSGKTYIKATNKSVVVDSSATFLTGTPAVAKFYEAVNGSFIDASGFSYTGSGTIGTQFTVGPGSNIWTNGRRSTHFPASSSSVSTNGGGVLY